MMGHYNILLPSILSFANRGFILEYFRNIFYRTPDLCAMQQDNSDHLDTVESILSDILQVYGSLPLT